MVTVFKKVANRGLFHSVQSSLIYFLSDFQNKSVVNSVNLIRVSIASSTSFCDGGDMGSLGTSSLSLMPPSTVSTGCERYSLTISSTDNGQDLLVLNFLSKSTSPSASTFSGDKSALAS